MELSLDQSHLALFSCITPGLFIMSHSVARFTTVSSDKIASIADEWRSLSNGGSNCTEPFLQPEWFIAYSRSFGSEQPSHLVTVRDGDSLTGILPLISSRFFLSKIPAKTLSSLSGIHSCRFDMIHGNGDASQIADSIWSSLRERSDWDVIETHDVPADGSFMHILKHAQRDGFLTGTWSTRKSPYLSLPSGESDPFANCPSSYKSFRHRLKSKLRKLEVTGRVSFNLHTTGEQDALAQFLKLESSGWKGANRSAIASDPSRMLFYSTIFDECAERGGLRMYSLTLDSKPIAMHLGIQMNDCYYAPKVAYDENFAAFSPGQLLVKHVIADLHSSGFKKYDFLGPRAPWKSVWTEHVREHQNCYIFRPTLKGRSLYTLSMQLGKSLRHLRHRIKGDPQACG